MITFRKTKAFKILNGHFILSQLLWNEDLIMLRTEKLHLLSLYPKFN